MEMDDGDDDAFFDDEFFAYDSSDGAASENDGNESTVPSAASWALSDDYYSSNSMSEDVSSEHSVDFDLESSRLSAPFDFGADIKYDYSDADSSSSSFDPLFHGFEAVQGPLGTDAAYHASPSAERAADLGALGALPRSGHLPYASGANLVTAGNPLYAPASVNISPLCDSGQVRVPHGLHPEQSLQSAMYAAHGSRMFNDGLRGNSALIPTELGGQHGSSSRQNSTAAGHVAAAVPGRRMLHNQLCNDVCLNPVQLATQQPQLPRASSVQPSSRHRLSQRDGSSQERGKHLSPKQQMNGLEPDIQTILQMALACSEARDRASAQKLWEWAEVLLNDESYGFKPRPEAIDGDRGIFREDAMVRRRLGPEADRWQNSGGKKGSIVWPLGNDKISRMRCQYGAVVRQGKTTLRFRVFTRIHRPEIGGSKNVTPPQRRLFIVTPYRKKPQNAQSTGRGRSRQHPAPSPPSVTPAAEPDDAESGPAQVSSELKTLLSMLEVNASKLVVDDSHLLSTVYELLANAPATRKQHLEQYHRPDILPNSLDRGVFLECGKVRRGGKGLSLKVDRWINTGGKYAVRECNLGDGRVLQKRAGRIQRSSNIVGAVSRAGHSELRYHQFKIGSGKEHDPELAATVFLVYAEESKSAAAQVKRAARSDTLRGSRQSKSRRTMSAAAVSASLLGLFGLLWFSMTRSTGSGPSQSHNNALPCAEGFYLFSSNDSPSSANQSLRCIRCTECGLESDYEKACTATSDAVCRPWRGSWQHLDMKVADPSTHPPQFAASWQSVNTTYMFGGSGSTRRNVRSGVKCYTSSTGITDELWKLDHTGSSGDGTWTLVSGGVLLPSSDSNVLPAGRAGAASWSVNRNTDGMVFGGSFDLCVESKTTTTPPNQCVISGCNNATHCGTFDRSNATCAGASVFENVHDGTVLLRQTDGRRSWRWIVAPLVRAPTTDGNSQCDTSDHYLESSWHTSSDTSNDPSALPDAYLYIDRPFQMSWWEAADKAHSFRVPPRDFSIIGRHQSDQRDSDTGIDSEAQGTHKDHDKAQAPIAEVGRQTQAVEPQFADGSGFYIPPNSLYLYSDTSGWTLLGGKDVWTQLGSLETAAALSDGYLSAGEASAYWPLPRSRSQTFTIGGSDDGRTPGGSAGMYMFSGRFQMVHSNLENANSGARTEDRLLNDLWVFNNKQPAVNQPVVERVALCGSTVDRPDILPYGTSYPGARQDAATWSVGSKKGQGWMFGGVGRSLGPSHKIASGIGVSTCSSDPFFTANGAGENIASLCDLWVLQPRQGWTVVFACSRDRNVFDSDKLAPVSHSIHGPTASVMSTAWIAHPEGQEGVTNPGSAVSSSALYLFGGVVDCSTPAAPACVDDRDGLLARLNRNCADVVSIIGCHADVHDYFSMAAPKGSLVSAACPILCDGCSPTHTAHGVDGTPTEPGTRDEGLAVCDMVWRMVDPSSASADDLDSVACSSVLWRFSLGTLKWDRVYAQPSHGRGSISWPTGRCGAYQVGPARGRSSFNGGNDTMVLAGGWSGSALGTCDAASPGSNFMLYSPNPSDLGVDDVRVPRYAAHGEAVCYPSTDAWRWAGATIDRYTVL